MTLRMFGKRLVVGLALVFFAGASAQGAGSQATSGAGRFFVHFGTYTGARSKGIYVSRFDAATGRLTAPELAAEVRNPSFLALHPTRRFLYAVNETWDAAGGRAGSVGAFAVDRQSGKLTPLNQQSSRGRGPCHVSVDASGRCVLVANYGGGSVAVLPVREDGSLGEATAFVQHEGSSVNQRRQEGPHAHGIYPDRANRFVFVPDLGLDKVMIYRFDAAHGSLAAHEPAFAAVKPGSGPRHLAFHPSGRFAYVINELASTVTAFACDAERGTLAERQTIGTLPEGFTNQSTTAEIEVHPNGKFLYGSNRGHDSIAVFGVDPGTGRLRLIEHQSTQGRTPRHFALDPTGRWLLAANQGTDNVVVFEIDAATGRLRPTGQRVEVGAPVCVTFMAIE